MSEEVRQHPILGTIRWIEKADSWRTAIELPLNNNVEFDIVAEGEWEGIDSNELFEIAVTFLEWARGFELRCREKIADDLLDLYNRSWADDDPEEGPPPLTRPEFLEAIHLTALSLYDGGGSSWSFEAGDLFAGHGIWIMVAKDESFAGKASLVG